MVGVHTLDVQTEGAVDVLGRALDVESGGKEEVDVGGGWGGVPHILGGEGEGVVDVLPKTALDVEIVGGGEGLGEAPSAEPLEVPKVSSEGDMKVIPDDLTEGAMKVIPERTLDVDPERALDVQTEGIVEVLPERALDVLLGRAPDDDPKGALDVDPAVVHPHTLHPYTLHPYTLHPYTIHHTPIHSTPIHPAPYTHTP